MPGWMSRRLGWSLFGAILISGMTLYLHAAFQPPAHLAESDCAECHLAGARTTPQNARQLVAGETVLCGRCHAAALKVSHPSDITPVMEVPPEFPLDWKGDLVCSSCHQIHDDQLALIRGGRLGRDLCLACHEQAFFDQMPDHGASLTGRGHLAARKATQPVPLDDFSLQCMECHNDKSGALGVDVDPGGILRHADNAMNHPIGRSYEEAMRFGGYRPPAMLREGILLPQGKLSCVSCHRGYSGEHGRLVMSNEGSALCLECHDI